MTIPAELIRQLAAAKRVTVLTGPAGIVLPQLLFSIKENARHRSGKKADVVSKLK